MALAVDVIKRAGKRPTESFDRDKLLRSIHAACLSVRMPEGEAESTAANVADAVVVWVNSKPAVTSNDLRCLASVHLQRFHPEAAYFYLHQRSIL